MVGSQNIGTECGDSSLYGHGRVGDLIFPRDVAIAVPQRETQEKLNISIECAANDFLFGSCEYFLEGNQSKQMGGGGSKSIV